MSSYISATYELSTRRRYTREEKEAMVAEAAREGSVSAVARRHRIAPAQLFRWKKEFAPAAAPEAAPAAPLASSATFVPAVLAPAVRKRKASSPRRARQSEETLGGAEIAEIAFPNGCVLRVPDGIEEAALARLVRALKA
ncbi:MAG: IS66-like element accessory protein TnpA [Pseudomonadota bacterium]